MKSKKNLTAKEKMMKEIEREERIEEFKENVKRLATSKGAMFLYGSLLVIAMIVIVGITTPDNKTYVEEPVATISEKVNITEKQVEKIVVIENNKVEETTVLEKYVNRKIDDVTTFMKMVLAVLTQIVFLIAALAIPFKKGISIKTMALAIIVMVIGLNAQPVMNSIGA